MKTWDDVASRLEEQKEDQFKNLDPMLKVERTELSFNSLNAEWNDKPHYLWCNPEQALVEPREYLFSQIEPALKETPRSNRTLSLMSVYEHLKGAGLLDKCLGFADGLEIQKHPDAFVKFFPGENRRLYLWREIFLHYTTPHCFFLDTDKSGVSIKECELDTTHVVVKSVPAYVVRGRSDDKDNSKRETLYLKRDGGKRTWRLKTQNDRHSSSGGGGYEHIRIRDTGGGM